MVEIDFNILNKIILSQYFKMSITYFIILKCIQVFTILKFVCRHCKMNVNKLKPGASVAGFRCACNERAHCELPSALEVSEMGGDYMEDDIKVGSKLIKLRKEKKMSITTLSKKSGVSTGMISQIERELVVPSVVSLWRLAQALDTNVSYFFDENKPLSYTLTRNGDHREIKTEKGFASYKLLSPNDSDRRLDMCMVTIKPGEDLTDYELITHEGEECGYVLKGDLTVALKDKEFVLHEGDSIQFQSNQPHKYLNRSDEECISIWGMTPAFF